MSTTAPGPFKIRSHGSLSSGPHACAASSLPTDLSLQSSHKNFKLSISHLGLHIFLLYIAFIENLRLGLEIIPTLMSLNYQSNQILDIFIRKCLNILHTYKISALKRSLKEFHLLTNITTYIMYIFLPPF